ncbi:hypothetical protein Dda_5661 [Drechslerella dactyloides]|uniref:Proteasome endopeptidase complex n=1 Tax=Drechslerella dactyloides TaxID=74499 RepID=A0AAD6IWX9_DREDA|nr:hypothetical protein Dda_5661 [Drechslerella dactyloides]
MRTKALFASACGPLLLSWALVTLASPLSGDIDKRAPCNRDNCLRGLIDGRWKSLGLEFCESIISYSPEVISTIYTTPIVTTTVSVPNSLVISTNQTITAPPAVEYVTEYTTVTAANATTRGINARLPLLRNTVRTTTSFMSTRTITRTYDNRKWGTIRMRDVAPTSTPAGLLKIISSCSSSRLSSACSCLTTEIPPVTTTTYLPFPIASTATEYATLDPATVTYTVLVTSTVVSTVTHVDTISTVRNYPAIAIPRFRAGTTTTTVNRVSTITYTSCLYTPTTPANANFDKVDGSWVVASGLSNRVTWTIDDTNPHTPGGKSGHIHFDQAGNYNFRLTAPIPQLCPTHSYRVSVWAASNMNGSPGHITSSPLGPIAYLHDGTGYDLSNSVFSPDGRNFQSCQAYMLTEVRTVQVEYAQKAVENGATTIGLRCKDGVILACEKLITSKLLVPGSNKRISSIDRHVGIATSGLIPDGKHFTNRARDESISWRRSYKESIPVASLADRMGSYAQAYTLYSSVRPFGVTAIIAGADDDGPGLYMIEPSGLYWVPHHIPPIHATTGHTPGYFGAATGKGRQAAKSEIEKLTLADLTLLQAVKEAARIIYVAHDDNKDKEFEIEMTWVTRSPAKATAAATGSKGMIWNGWVHEEVPRELVEEAAREAKKALEEDDDEEDAKGEKMDEDL